jgi:hypothetical protein
MPPDDGFAKHIHYLSFARNYCVYVWRDPRCSTLELPSTSISIARSASDAGRKVSTVSDEV